MVWYQTIFNAFLVIVIQIESDQLRVVWNGVHINTTAHLDEDLLIVEFSPVGTYEEAV